MKLLFIRSGIKQHLKNLKDESDKFNKAVTPDCAENNAGERLREKFKRGKMNAKEVVDFSIQVQHNAAGSSRDCATQRYSKCGANGTQPRNMHRDPILKMEKEKRGLQCDVYVKKIPYWDSEANKAFEADTYFNLPHEVFEDTLTADNMDETISLDNNPRLRSTLDDWEREQGVEHDIDQPTAAFGVWGDGAPYHTRDGLVLLLYNILGNVHNERWWFCAFSKRMACNCGCKGRHTYEACLQVLRYGLGICRLGKRPHFRDDGVTLLSESKFKGDKARSKLAGNKLVRF